MFKIITLARTTGQISKLNVTNEGGKERKKIFFTVASDRPYKSSKVVDGKTVLQRQSDFMFCKAMGRNAEIIDKYCKEKGHKEGIYASRLLLLEGHLEKYQSNKAIELKKIVELPVNDVPKKAEITFTKKDYKVTETIFCIQSITFVDSNKPKSSNTTTSISTEDVSIKFMDKSVEKPKDNNSDIPKTINSTDEEKEIKKEKEEKKIAEEAEKEIVKDFEDFNGSDIDVLSDEDVPF